MSKNKNLNRAKKEKNDEFYTLYQDIEKELIHYKHYLKDKIIYCNRDNPKYSNFYKYLKDNFNELKLKHLYCTGYNKDGKGYYGEYNGINEIIKPLNDNGDFRSEECIELLIKSDIIITNPPFSLFRYYVAQLMEYGKKFLIIGNGNAVTYKEIFPYIKNNELWLGIYSNKSLEFVLPDNCEKYNKIKDGIKIGIVPSICWFTNINHNKQNQPLDLNKTYNEIDYPKYDNYDAIEVSKVADIPIGYQGIMGVPITFLDKYCPSQFEIVGARYYTKDYNGNNWNGKINGRSIYSRLLIRKIN